VRLVVDANILISALIRSDGTIGDLLIRTYPPLELFAPEYIRIETSLRREKVAKLNRSPIAEVAEAEEVLLSLVTTVQPAAINTVEWEHAHQLVASIDPKDDHYVALALHLKCPLWTGDKKLIKGLRAKGFKQVHSTEEVRALLKKK